MNQWKLNVWTGVHTLQLTQNVRIVRQSFNDGTHLYMREFWGDFSLAYPVSAGWVSSLPQAKRARCEGEDK
jgi:hypothetical protein